MTTRRRKHLGTMRASSLKALRTELLVNMYGMTDKGAERVIRKLLKF